MKNYINYSLALLFLYMVFSFYEWNLNPGDWDTFSRTILAILLGLYILIEKK